MVKQGRETPTALRSGESVGTKLLGIADKARREPRLQFTSLYQLMNQELLGVCFHQLSNNKAAGIDQVTKEMYANNLEANLSELEKRLHRMAYIPQPVRRVYIPKPGSDKKRPLGIPCLEDKLVQTALVRILEAIYEHDFIEDSYGFRPGRSCHDALRQLTRTVEKEQTNYIVEADIKGFFDNVDQEWLMKFLAHRIADKRILRMIKRFLKAGVAEDGEVKVSDTGTPQGGSVSPMLANIYLHYVLDLWFQRVYRKSCRGKARLIRYCDDFVACFQNKEDAARFQAELIKRLKKFGLEVEPTKTQMLEFGPYAQKQAQERGERAKTFDFLGLTHYCSKSRDGRSFRMKRKTSSKKLRAKVRAMKEWLKRSRTQPTRWIWEKVGEKLRGHYAYYGVTDNWDGISRYGYAVTLLLMKWLNRRGKRRCLNWEKFNLMLERFPLPQPRIVVSMY